MCLRFSMAENVISSSYAVFLKKTFQEVKKCQDTIRPWHDCNLHEVWPGFQGLPKKSWKFRLNDNLYEGSWYFRNCTDWELTDKLEVNIRSDSNWKEAINLLKPGCKEAASCVLHFVCFYSIDVQFITLLGENSEFARDSYISTVAK